MAKPRIPSQIELVTSIMKGLAALGVKAMPPNVMNACVESANLILFQLSRPLVPAKASEGLDSWLRSDDTGLSSLFMAHVLVAGPEAENRHPLDADDFGRCSRFLASAPEARDRLYRLRECGPAWTAIETNWSALENMLAARNYKALNDFLRDPALAAKASLKQ